MTRRERLERKLELRREWAEKAETRSNALSEQSHKMLSVIPMGQPILVGHHSEKRDRNYRNRAWNKMGKAVEQSDLAKHHVSKAGGLENQLDKAIFSDDSDAVEAIQARIAENETKREQMKRINALYRKADVAGLESMGINYETLKAKLAAAGGYWGSAPHLAYELSNLGQRISGDRKRLEVIKSQNERRAEAEASLAGVVLKECAGGYCRVTFAEKPDREILTALRAAGFWWGNASWSGKSAALPESVRVLLEEPPMQDQHSEPSYENQLWHARKLFNEKGYRELDNPHGMTGRSCGCGTCFCCAAAQVIAEHVHDWSLDADDTRVCACGERTGL